MRTIDKNLADWYRKAYTNKELAYAYLKDLVIDIRCARRDHCAANPLLGYAETCIAEFRALWNRRGGSNEQI